MLGYVFQQSPQDQTVAGLGGSVCCSAEKSSWVKLLSCGRLVSQFLLPALAGWIVALVVVPGVLVVVTAVLWLLDKSRRKHCTDKQEVMK